MYPGPPHQEQTAKNKFKPSLEQGISDRNMFKVKFFISWTSAGTMVGTALEQPTLIFPIVFVFQTSLWGKYMTVHTGCI